MKTLPPLYTSTRMLNIMAGLKIEYLEDLAAMSAIDFLDLRMVGVVTLNEARDLLAEHDMAFEVDSERLSPYSEEYRKVREGIKEGKIGEYRRAHA